MTETTEIHVGDVGTRFEVTVYEDAVALDISAATVKNFIFGKPSGDVVSVAAGFVTDGTNGKLYYLSTGTDLDEAGNWELEVELDLSPWAGRTTRLTFVVSPILEVTTP
jgi:hypothetical protein